MGTRSPSSQVAVVAAGCVRGKQLPVWAVWHGPGLSGALGLPVGRPLAAQGAVGALLKGAEGPGKSGDPRRMPVAGGYFWTGVFFLAWASSLHGEGLRGSYARGPPTLCPACAAVFARSYHRISLG